MIEKMDKEKEANEFMGGRDMEYRVGDKVKIREWEDMVEEYGVDCKGCIYPPKGATIVPRMKEFCGTETTIKRGPDFRGNFTLEIDRERWVWPECTLLPVGKLSGAKKKSQFYYNKNKRLVNQEEEI